jgi:hypothetical protein
LAAIIYQAKRGTKKEEKNSGIFSGIRKAHCLIVEERKTAKSL